MYMAESLTYIVIGSDFYIQSYLTRPSSLTVNIQSREN